MKAILTAVLLLLIATSGVAQVIELGPSTEKSVQWFTVKVPEARLVLLARVTGVVQVEIAFKGCKLDPESVHVINRPSDAPQARKTLEDAATEALKHSELGCGDFKDAKTVLTYEFALKTPRRCYVDEGPEFTVHNNYIRLLWPAMCVEASGSPTAVK